MWAHLHLGQELIAITTKNASVLAGMDECILEDRKINIAPLELSTEPRHSELADELGHYHHRREIAAAYNKSSKRLIHHSKLFEEAKELAAKASQSACSTPEAKNEYQLVHGNVVAVVGQAGIGKSTLTKLLVREALNNGLFNAKMIIYLKCRDLDYDKKMNFLQFLTDDSKLANEIDKNQLNKICSKLCESNDVCIICDGFDESKVTKTEKPIAGNCSVYCTEKAETFIKYLLAGRLLPRAKKLFTSRPRQLYDLPSSSRPQFTVNVLGLNKESQLKICRDVCESDNACSQVYQFVTSRLDLVSFCYVPANCILVMYCLSESFKSDYLTALKCIDSITTIFVATLGLFIRNGHLRHEEFRTKNLSSLAYATFRSNQIMFEKRDLIKASIRDDEASTFLNTRLGKRANLKLWRGITSTKFFFSHLMLHEFFVSVFFILFLENNEFREGIPDFKEPKFEMVVRFVFGLCNTVTQDYFEELIPSEELKLSYFEEKKEMLANFALEQIASPKVFTDLLPVFSWIYELRDDELTEKAVSRLSNEIKINGAILPSDIPCLQYVLLRRRAPMDLSVKQPDFKGDCFEQFFIALCSILEAGFITVS